MARSYTAAGLPLPGARRLRADRHFHGRFWSKVSRKDAGRDDCWQWMGARDEKGYGRFRISCRPSMIYQAHRVSWMLANRRWPRADRMVLHSCDNPSCVNPRHLREGTAQDNQDDIDARGRRRRRLRGHWAGTEFWRDRRADSTILRGGSILRPDQVLDLRKAVRRAGGEDAARRKGALLLLALELDINEDRLYDAATRRTFRWVRGGEL